MRMISHALFLSLMLLLTSAVALAVKGDYARDGSSPLPTLPSDAELRQLYPELDPLPTGDRLLDLYGEARLSAFRAEAWLGEKKWDEILTVSGWYEYSRNYVDFVKPPRLEVQYEQLPQPFREKWYQAYIDHSPAHYLSAKQIEALEPEFGADPRYWQLRAFGFGRSHTDTFDFNERAYREIIGAFKRNLADEDLLYELRTLFAYADSEFVSDRLGEYDVYHIEQPADPEKLQREHEMAVSLVAELGLDAEGLYTAMIAKNPQRLQSYVARAVFYIKHDRTEDALADLRKAELATDYRGFSVFPDNTVLELLQSGIPVNPVEFDWSDAGASVLTDFPLAMSNASSDILQSSLAFDEKMGRLNTLYTVTCRMGQASNHVGVTAWTLSAVGSILNSIILTIKSGEEQLRQAVSLQCEEANRLFEEVRSAGNKPSLTEMLATEPALVSQNQTPTISYFFHLELIGRPGVERRVLEDSVSLRYFQRLMEVEQRYGPLAVHVLLEFDLTRIPLSGDAVIDMVERSYDYRDPK